MLRTIIKKFFWTYSERLYKLMLPQVRKVPPKQEVSFVRISEDNYLNVKSVRPGSFYVRDFKKMLSLGDYGIYVCVNGMPVGYGWAKEDGSQDYFFHVRGCYLCRFYVNPEWRGKNFYPAMICQLIQYFQEKGVDTFYIAVESKNMPSRKGIEKVGFVYQETLRFYRLTKMTLNKYQLGK